MITILPENKRRETQKTNLIKTICFFVWGDKNKALEAIGIADSHFNAGMSSVQSAYAGILFVRKKTVSLTKVG